MNEVHVNNVSVWPIRQRIYWYMDILCVWICS